MSEPQVNDKVKIGDEYGTIIKVFEPNEYHSGRFIVHMHGKHYEYDAEFWYSDFGTSVIKVSKKNNKVIKI